MSDELEREYMEIKKSIEDKKLLIKVEGRLDSTTANDLEAAINESIEDKEEVVIDFTNLEYISSAGLRVLLATQKIMAKQGILKVCGLNETVKEIFDVTGFSDILTIE